MAAIHRENPGIGLAVGMALQRPRPMMFQRDPVQMPPTAERRPKSRRRALLGGMVVHSGGRFSFPVTIRNLSEDGARIAFKKGQMMPSDFYLVDTWAGMGHRARIAWVTASEAGVAFSQSFDMNAITDPGLGYLARLWKQRVV
jgi:hypothetical protein